MGRTRDSGLDGVLVVDKPTEWTSHDVVAKLRAILHQRRAGHSGTLDPDATGVLLIGFGQATKLLPLLTALPKTYTAEIVLGIETNTLDSSGVETFRHDMGDVTEDRIRVAATRFVGEIRQIPPMVSAVQIGGQRLHDLARQGIVVDRPERPVTVHRFDVVEEIAPGVWSIEVVCGTGTYVRSLAADLGTALGGGAHLRNLRRTRIGSFSADEGVDIADVTAQTPLRSPADALRDYPAISVADDALRVSISNGRMIRRDAIGAESDGPWAVLDPAGTLIAVYEAADPLHLKARIVIPVPGR